MMTEDKSKSLRSLKIDRSAEKTERSGSRWLPISAAIIACVVGFAAFAAFEFRRQDPPKETVQQSVAQPQTPQLPQQTATSSKPAGTLAASGYVVARRRAESADAAIAAITADLEDATRIMSRIRTLSQKNFATEADLTKAQARVGVLSAQLRQAKSQFETARIDAKRSASMLDKHQIKAPFAGVVVDRSAQPGEMISPMSVGGYTRTGICTIVDMDSIEIEVDVNEAFIGRVVPGGAVNAMLDAYPDWTIPASVIAIVPTANREKATVKVRIRFEKKDPRILPDMAVKVNFLADAKAKAATETTAAN